MYLLCKEVNIYCGLVELFLLALKAFLLDWGKHGIIWKFQKLKIN